MEGCVYKYLLLRLRAGKDSIKWPSLTLLPKPTSGLKIYHIPHIQHTLMKLNLKVFTSQILGT